MSFIFLSKQDVKNINMNVCVQQLRGFINVYYIRMILKSILTALCPKCCKFSSKNSIFTKFFIHETIFREIFKCTNFNI